MDLAVRDVDVIVHCASSPRKTREIDVEGTKRLLKAADRAGVSHVVFISIVGIDRNPYFPYYRMKLETERLIESSPCRGPSCVPRSSTNSCWGYSDFWNGCP